MFSINVIFKLWHIKNFIISLIDKESIFYKIRKIKKHKIDPYDRKNNVKEFIFPYKDYSVFYQRVLDINKTYIENKDILADYSESLEHKTYFNMFFSIDGYKLKNSKTIVNDFLELCLEIKFFKDCYKKKYTTINLHRLRYISLLDKKVDNLINNIFNFL